MLIDISMLRIVIIIIDTIVFFAFYILRNKLNIDNLVLMMNLVEERFGREIIISHIPIKAIHVLKYKVSDTIISCLLYSPVYS